MTGKDLVIQNLEVLDRAIAAKDTAATRALLKWARRYGMYIGSVYLLRADRRLGKVLAYNKLRHCTGRINYSQSVIDPDKWLAKPLDLRKMK